MANGSGGNLLWLLLALGAAIFALVHWRYHPRATPLSSWDSLRQRLGGGRPVLLQFHAPL